MNSDAAPAAMEYLAYQALVRRLRDLIHRSVPPGATVLVISKGDAALVSLVGRRGWHFPQDDSGGYAGYHPRDSAAAIAELETMRSRGADFLVLPATANWWLEHYTDFGDHLRLNYETLVEQSDAGAIYTLRKRPTPKVIGSGSKEEDLGRHRQALLRQQIEDLAGRLVPPKRPVVVIDTGDAGALQLDDRETMLLPTSPPVTGDALATGVTLVARLESLRRQGAACLIVARGAFDWWQADGVLRSHVERRYRCITRQTHVCLIYDLDPAEGAVST